MEDKPAREMTLKNTIYSVMENNDAQDRVF